MHEDRSMRRGSMSLNRSIGRPSASGSAWSRRVCMTLKMDVCMTSLVRRHSLWGDCSFRHRFAELSVFAEDCRMRLSQSFFRVPRRLNGVVGLQICSRPVWELFEAFAVQIRQKIRGAPTGSSGSEFAFACLALLQPCGLTGRC